MYYSTTLQINGYDVPIRVYYVRHQKEYGAREVGSGMQLEPDVPEHVEIEYIEMGYDKNTFEQVNFPEEVVESIADEIMGDV